MGLRRSWFRGSENLVANRGCPQAIKSLEGEGLVSVPLSYRGEKRKGRKWGGGRLSFCFDFLNTLSCLKMRAIGPGKYFFFIFHLHGVACETLVLLPGNDPVPPAVEVWGSNHWNAREVPLFIYF